MTIPSKHAIFFNNYSGLPLSTGAKKRAVTVMAAPLQPKQRVRSESAAGTGADSVKGKSTPARLAPKRSG
ncbi:MAG: hypothetical protein AABZ10_00840 [Nitrospirota bacterium]